MSPESKRIRSELLAAFTAAMISSEWDKALECCSPRVIQASQDYVSTEEFFVQSIPVSPIRLKAMDARAELFETSIYKLVRMTHGKSTTEIGEKLAFRFGCESFNSAWVAKIVQMSGKWRIDFNPEKLTDQFAELLHPLKASQDEVIKRFEETRGLR